MFLTPWVHYQEDSLYTQFLCYIYINAWKTYHTELHVQMVCLMMNTWCSNHVEDTKNWIKHWFEKCVFCWFTLHNLSQWTVQKTWSENICRWFVYSLHPSSAARLFLLVNYLRCLLTTYYSIAVSIGPSVRTNVRLSDCPLVGCNLKNSRDLCVS
jgi:hypothetical protein